MAELPLDIHEPILLRLDVKDLIRCKSVCKSWYSLISNDRFINLHLKTINETGQHKRIVLSSSMYSYTSRQCTLYDSSSCRMIGSSNGLVCIFRLSNEILVVNPSIRAVKKVIYPHSHAMETVLCFGFGYNSSTDDYKVVLGFGKNKYTSFVMFSLKSDFWKDLGKVKYILNMSEAGMLCNGALHWFTKDKKVIISLDLCKEKFQEIPQPYSPRCEYTLDRRLGILEGCLCISYHWKTINICVMKNNDNVKDSWELIFLNDSKIKTDDVLPKVQELFPTKNFFGHVHIWLCEDIGSPAYVMSPHGNSHIWLSTNSEDIGASVFVHSLVSPHGNPSGRVKRKRCNESGNW